MNFQNLKNIESYKTYLDIAFSKAKKSVDLYKQKSAKKGPMIMARESENTRIDSISDALNHHFLAILKSFPQVDSLPEFYNELIKCTIDYPELKKSLGAVNWAVDKISEFTKFYRKKIVRCEDLRKIYEYRTQYYGRISSILRQIKNNLVFLEAARRIMKSYPAIKTSLPTVVIAGFPNVGKTTLLYNLTGSKPEIQSYAFTTKGINQGFLNNKVQILDTPGTLNRFDKMNNIEKIAYLAIKHCADILVYVFDLTEPYPLSDQIKLYETLKQEREDIIIYLSKSDLLSKDIVKSFRFKHLPLAELNSRIKALALGIAK